MREIKFRAWDKYHEEMVRVDAIALERNCFSTKSYIYGSQPHFYDEHNDLHLLEECELMQYTGLKDNNGKEIYEGDIVEAEYCIDGCLDYVEDEYGVIQWDEEECGFNLIFKDELAPSPVSDYVSFEVVGNIYENPELLEITND